MKRLFLPFFFSLMLPIQAADLSNGLMHAVPVPKGIAPKIDGNLEGWDLSGAVDTWLALETADKYRASIYAMYDDEALYLAAKVSLPGRKLRNPHSPIDRYWDGDCLQFRIIADPAAPYPSTVPMLLTNERVATINVWKDTLANKDELVIAHGVKFNMGNSVNPPGSQVFIKEGPGAYTVECRVPWSALKIPNGKNPFKPGEEMTFVAEVLWDSTNLRTAVVYREAPGVFAFHGPQKWGRLQFSDKGNLPRRFDEIDVHLNKLRAATKAAQGVPIELTLKKDAKVSLNIIGENGEVLRELAGGEPKKAGRHVWAWDGLDQWGNPLVPGTYRWGAYLSQGLKPIWMGSVGSSGNPSYPTEDGRGGWGGDHGDPVDVSASDTGLYMLWMWAEEGRALIKTDFEGNVLWRRTPFVAGGFGPFYHVAANQKYCYFIHGMEEASLGRLDAKSGMLLSWGDDKIVPVAKSPLSKEEVAAWVKETGKKVGEEGIFPYLPSVVTGLVANDKVVFAAVEHENAISIFDAETGKKLRSLSVAGPRGLALDAKGDLYAVSISEKGEGKVVRFKQGSGSPVEQVSAGLVSPWDVAVDSEGKFHVTDGGTSQQVKVFSSAGKELRHLGKEGGRPWMGAYDGKGLLRPAGIVADPKGGVVVAECSLPKIISRYTANDGRLVARWFGGTSYGATNIPDPEDPWVNYYSLSSDPKLGNVGGFARARIPKAGETGYPDAYWNLILGGYPAAGSLLDTMSVPELFIAENGRQYLANDTNRFVECHGVALVEGDSVRPVAHARVRGWNVASNKLDPKIVGLEFWMDLNGDHQIQPEELSVLDQIEGKPMPALSLTTGASWMAKNGDLYFITQANSILKVPSKGFHENGTPLWDLAKASVAIYPILPSLNDKMAASYRSGPMGVRRDAEGNLYTCFNTVAPYATPELTKSMMEGMGHASSVNAVKLAKYSPKGELLWMAGRKATRAARPGEMYHLWVLGGLVNDRYIVGASEWGTLYFYTHDGFFVDTLMEDPTVGAEAGPYTFGGETFAGRVSYFPKQDEVWAYSMARAFKVEGFKKGIVEGEQRLYGTVKLDKAYLPNAKTTGEEVLKNTPTLLRSLKGTSSDDWKDIPASKIMRNGAVLANVQVGYDAENLYARFEVEGLPQIKNGADTLDTIFKGGDCVGLLLGPAGKRKTPGLGDVRFLATIFQGKPVLVAFKPVSNGPKNQATYFTPAGGKQVYDFVGAVPTSAASFNSVGDKQIIQFSIPRKELEFTIKPGEPIALEAEVLLSGQASRGLQVTSRNFLYSPTTPQTSMVDDLVVEARLYPEFWGEGLVE